MKKWTLAKASLFGVLCAMSVEAAAIIKMDMPKAPRLLSASNVEDDGGFENSQYIETDDYSEGGPIQFKQMSAEERKAKGKDVYLLNAGINGASTFEDSIVRIDSRERICTTQTKMCAERQFGRFEAVRIIIDKSYKLAKNSAGKRYVSKPQTLLIEADMGDGNWIPFIEDVVSTGAGAEYDTPAGVFPLALANGGRLKGTRNHCSSVADYGNDQGSFVELAPMPYAVHFNGGIAMHAGRTTGKPESHGCVRQRPEIARLTYCLLLEQDNWKRATVIVR